jgi:hypothetical protein
MYSKLKAKDGGAKWLQYLRRETAQKEEKAAAHHRGLHTKRGYQQWRDAHRNKGAARVRARQNAAKVAEVWRKGKGPEAKAGVTQTRALTLTLTAAQGGGCDSESEGVWHPGEE